MDILNLALTDLFPSINDEERIKRISHSLEEIKFTKGNIETKILIGFSKSGYPVGTSYNSTLVYTEEEKKIRGLNRELSTALSQKNYRLAADIQDQIDEIKTNTKKGS